MRRTILFLTATLSMALMMTLIMACHHEPDAIPGQSVQRSAPPASSHPQASSAPLTASVRRVEVEVGSRVEIGERVAVLEAMKMEFPVLADVAGVVEWLGAKPGQMVSAGEALVGVTCDA